MFELDIEVLAARLKVIESVALIPRVTSTHDLARMIVAECLDNELPPPAASLIALEQSAGRGRGARSWSSPPDGGNGTRLGWHQDRGGDGALAIGFFHGKGVLSF